MCRKFYEFESEVSSLERGRHEVEAYDVPPRLGPLPREKLGTFLQDNRTLLEHPEAFVLEALSSEMARLSHVATFEERDLCFYTAVRAFALPYEYARFELRLPADERREATVAWIRLTSSQIVEYFRSLESAPIEDSWRALSTFAGSLVVKWRSEWMKYGQLGQLVIAGRPPQPDVPPDSRTERFRDARRPADDRREDDSA